MPPTDSDTQDIAELPVAVLVPADLGQEARAIVPLLGRAYTLGRSVESNIVLPESDSSVSRSHARLTWNGDTHELEDAGSSHGTTINGSRLNPGRAYRLNDGDLLGFAASRFVH